MLTRITIKNLALIRDLEIEFSNGLNVFTGETGAGKSIIVDSLMLLIGARYDKTMLKYGEEKGFVEGVFTFDDKAPLDEFGIDSDDGMFIVTRRFNKDGKNDIRINGKQATTAMLREFMSAYVDIYGQNEYQSLLRSTEQRKILDYYVFKKDGAPLENQKKLFREYRDICERMQRLGDETARAQRIDILKYQIGEIESAAVGADEEQALIDRRHKLMSAERIKSALSDCLSALDSDGGAIASISDGARTLASVSQFSESYSTLRDRLKSCAIELDDIAACLKDEADGMDGGERELDDINARLDKLRALKSKYGAFDAMQKFLSKAKEELNTLENGADEYDALLKKETALKKSLYENCLKLSEMRRKGAEELGKKIVDELSYLGMEHSRFEVKFQEQPRFDDFTQKTSSSGFDEFEFYLSPNAGQPLLPLAKIISGGEMSRFMLAIKLITGDLGNIDTMIFDEIDAGISGAVGLSVAKKLCALSRSRQVLCVTHLPQIAVMADSHLFIQKSDVGGEAVTNVTPLDREGKIAEVSRLSGTRGVTGTSDKNAEEMKDWADKYKDELVKQAD